MALTKGGGLAPHHQVATPPADQIAHDAQAAVAVAPLDLVERDRRRRRVGDQEGDQAPPGRVLRLLHAHQHPRIRGAARRRHRVAHQVGHDGLQGGRRDRQIHVQGGQVQPRGHRHRRRAAGRLGQRAQPGGDGRGIQPRARGDRQQRGQRRAMPLAQIVVQRRQLAVGGAALAIREQRFGPGERAVQRPEHRLASQRAHRHPGGGRCPAQALERGRHHLRGGGRLAAAPGPSPRGGRRGCPACPARSPGA